MRNYEIAVVLHPDIEIDLESTMEKIEKVFTQFGGKITKKDNWGKRKLAYRINNQDWGIYVFYQIQIEPSVVEKINQKLRITDEVMRYLVISLENIKFVNKSTEKTKNKTALKTTGKKPLKNLQSTKKVTKEIQ